MHPRSFRLFGPVLEGHSFLNRVSPSQHQSLLLVRHQSTNTATTQQSTQAAASRIVRPLIPPPSENSGPLLTRMPNRALPTLEKSRTWLKTLPIFLALITASSLAIFNYQKSSSSTVNSILYALRTNDTARAVLGDEIYFASKIPWISGELNLLHGHIDISFWVKGTKGKAKTRFVSVRKKRDGYFETLEWSMQSEGGPVVQLLDEDPDAGPMGKAGGKRS